MEEKNTGSLCINVHVEGLQKNEVMESMRRMVIKPYLILWVVVYAIMAVVMIVKGVTVYTLLGPAVILLLLALAYEYSGHKNFPKMGYDKAVMDYQLTPGGYTLTVGEKSATIKWDGAWIVETKHDLLLYSDKNNCSVLPKRFLQDGEKEKILSWASKK